ncbi:hypothetical protein F9802_00940 [Bacillus aerolatus]|uniref:YqfQ-like protein n=1 Tax=Bacillus aerolatus TaxID=2653354 RepID=A0A6I1FJ98_9BACI|nr:VrrA/YqfQ family protein [Bacillus aerolatus]KAB7708748.1 hypothetical protein F9802_00940 [Bacillus aerolatus]
MIPFQHGNRPLPPHYYPPAARPFPGPRPNAAPQRPGRGLFGRMRQRSSPQLTGFERRGTAAAAQKLTNPMNLQQMLANTQQILNTVQQMGPIVEQYGPLVKNLPSMWKLYRGLKALPDEKEKAPEPAGKVERTEKEKDKEKQAPPPLKREPKSSGPKLYI